MRKYREYIIFEDGGGKIFAIWVDMVPKCLFATMTGEIKEVDSGNIKNDRFQLKELFKRQREFTKGYGKEI